MVAHPSSPTAESFMELGAGLVREVAKMQRQERNAVRCMPQGPLAVVVPGLAGRVARGECGRLPRCSGMSAMQSGGCQKACLLGQCQG